MTVKIEYINLILNLRFTNNTRLWFNKTERNFRFIRICHKFRKHDLITCIMMVKILITEAKIFRSSKVSNASNGDHSSRKIIRSNSSDSSLFRASVGVYICI